MAVKILPAWKRTPVLRLLIPLAAGIAAGRGFAGSAWWIPGLIILAVLCGAIYYLFSIYLRYRQGWISGLTVNLLFVATGAGLFSINVMKNRPHWFGNEYKRTEGLIVSLDEAPREKPNSWMATASVHYLLQQHTKKAVCGKIILYLEKDSAGSVAAPGPVRPGGGSFLLIAKPVQLITPSGNPGGLDFRQYAYTKGITHQVFLKASDYDVLLLQRQSRITVWIESIRQHVLNVFHHYIRDPGERGLAEALLIGYKDELDKDLVRSYSNTGVVHIIAISGLHLGLIYGLLVLICRPLQRFRWLRAILILSGLWLFSILAGAQPSVLRSALMFSCIVSGELIGRRGTAINSLFFSALLLLCINPWWLWDAGFQLSYAAVLSIMLYQRPIYNLLYIRNKLSDFIWQLNSVTLAAQLLTFPVSVYWFHQFPVYFMLTNLLAVPLSSLIVLAEILLMAVAGIPVLGNWTASAISAMIRIMNTWIRHIEWMPFSSWGGMQVSVTQAALITLSLVWMAMWMQEKKRNALFAALLSGLCFCMMRSIHFYKAQHQELLIIYNIPRMQLIECICGREAMVISTERIADTSIIFRTYLKPAHDLYRIRGYSETVPDQKGFCLQWGDRSICVAESAEDDPPAVKRISLLIVSAGGKTIPEQIRPDRVVADGTLTGKGLQRLKEQCESRHIPFYSVREQGAFVMTLP